MAKQSHSELGLDLRQVKGLCIDHYLSSPAWVLCCLYILSLDFQVLNGLVNSVKVTDLTGGGTRFKLLN